ncbi:unnamed protein product [Rhizophagus irregularis]|nr:unnamed protein product [Rhizophagus irregularis]
MSMDKSRTPNEAALDFVSKFNEIYFQTFTHHLSSFVQDGFLKDLFEKNPSVTKDKAKLLIEKFGDTANPANFTSQAQATNIQPTTLFKFGDLGSDDDDDDADTDDYLMDESPLLELDEDDLLRQGFQMPPYPVPIKLPSMPDIVMTPVDQTVIPKNSRKKDKQKARVTDDKQVKNQSTTAKPDAKTSAKNSHKGKKTSELEATQILTGYETNDDEQERCSVKRQHKYQTLRVKIALSSFALPQFNKCWTTDLGGIPVRWFPASWTLRERKQREKFQAIIHDIPEDMTMATLWTDRKPCNFLMICGANSFKIIQTSKGRRKLVAYFENWETTLKALNTPQPFVPDGAELKWCRHSIPNLKKARKPKTKNTLDKKKSDNSGKVPVSNQPKKKDNTKSSKKVSKNNNQEKNHPNTQKKAKNSSKKKAKQPVEAVPEVTQILTGFKEADDQREQVRDIIVYDILYTWDVEKILGELTLWGNTIKLSVKRQHKYQTLRVKIVLNSFTLPQFNKFWTTDLGGIPFQAVIHDIPEEMTMATLWNDRKPTTFLTSCGANTFKIIQTSKGKRKLVGYFENWEATLKVLDTPQVFLTLDKELRWCQHSVLP